MIAAQDKIDLLRAAIHSPEVSGRTWSAAEAYAYCERLARSHYENFPVGSLLVPRRLRRHFYAIYAFARTADDFADEGYGANVSEADRLALLDEWRAMLRRSEQGEARHPVFVALAATRAEFELPAALFEDLLSAFAQDVVKRRYESFEELLDYCRRSANPVGRLILLLFGHRDAAMMEQSDAICSGLQLANHWQDVAVDLDKDRVYLPAEDMARFGLGVEDLERRQASPAFCELLRFEVERARRLFRAGQPLCVAVGGRLGMELRAVWAGGWRILDRIEENGFDVFARRPVITAADKLRVLGAALGRGAFARR